MGKLNLKFQENANFLRTFWGSVLALLEKIWKLKEVQKNSKKKIDKLDKEIQENVHFLRTFWGVILDDFLENCEDKIGRKFFKKKYG